MTTPNDWDRWQTDWRATGELPGSPELLRARVERERRRLRSTAIAELVLRVLAVAGIAATLLHSANARDVIRVGLVLALIAMTSWIEMKRRRVGAVLLTETTEDYLQQARRLYLQQRRSIRLLWLLLAVTLAFMAAWWREGLEVHQGYIWSPLALLALWLPLIFVAGVLAWTVRASRRIAGELRRLDRLVERGDAE